MMFVLGLLRGLSIWGKIANALGAFVRWAERPISIPRGDVAALAAVIAVLGWMLHGAHAETAAVKAKDGKVIASLIDTTHRFQSAFTLIEGAVQKWSDTGKQLHVVQQAGLARARQESADRVTSAARQSADSLKQAPGADCRTPDAVMADKGRI